MTDIVATTIDAILASAGGRPGQRPPVVVDGEGALPSAFSVTELAVATIGAAAVATAELVGVTGGTPVDEVRVDRRLASRWFSSTIDPIGWRLPPVWDEVAGDYPTSDGWIRLHTNAPHHRRAALAVLDCVADRNAVAASVATWSGDDLEAAVVGAGGCAAAMRSVEEWSQHPQGKAVAAEPLMHHRRTAAGTRSHPENRPVDTRPLEGVRVLDLTRVLAGPVATRWLAGLGADVLRIDPPDWEEPPVVPEVVLGKRCARLDLERPDDHTRLVELLSRADVLVHGYRPGALARWGLDETGRDAIRPGLVDVSLDAYGWTGPWSGRRGFDSLVQMSSGIAHLGQRVAGSEGPRPLPVQALDHATGYLMAAAALRGLTDRSVAGAGTRVTVSLARTAALLVELPLRTFDQPGISITPVDYGDAVEETPWGPARRLRPPATVPGIDLRWDLPSAELGSAPARWPGTVPD